MSTPPPSVPTASPAAVEKLQRAALHQLFTALYWRGRQTLRNQKTAQTKIFARKYGPLLLYALIGMALLVYSFGNAPNLVASTMPHAMTFMLAGMTMASACGGLLFNDQESDILLHRPVRARLILIAKVRVLYTQTVLMALALNLAVMIVRGLRGGALTYVPAHIFSVALEALFCVSAVVLTFQLCVKWFGQDKLKSLITAAQVVTAMVLMLGSQLAPRMMRTTDFKTWETSPWIMALPPAWFGAIDTLAVTLQPTAQLLTGALLAVVLTVLMTWLAFVRLAGTYEEAVITLNEHDSSPALTARDGTGAASGSKTSSSGGSRWPERLAALPGIRWWLRDPGERIGFLLTAVQLTRARDVKLRVYPQVAQFVLYPVIFSLGMRSGGGASFAGGAVAGCLGIICLTTVSLLRYSEEYRGSEVFRFAPLTSPGPLFFGARKAAMLLVVVPVMLLWVVMLLLFARQLDTLLMILPGLIVAHVMSFVPALRSPFLPFSETQADSKNMGGCLTMIFSFGFTIIQAFISAAALAYGYFWQWLILLAVLALTCDFFFRRIIRSHEIATNE